MEDGSLEQQLIKEMKIIYKYLVKIGATKEDAEDIIQDTLYKTIKNISGIPEDKIKPWLFKVAINGYYNIYNRNKKYSILTLEDTESTRLLSDSIDEHIISKESKEKVLHVLNSIKVSYRNLLVLKYFMDFSYKEIANILELSENQVKTYLYRARSSFRTIWEGLSDEKI